MKDRVVGIFENQAEAEKAMSDLVAWGVERVRVTVKRVLEPTHRGLSDAEAVHSLIHAPEIRGDDTTSQDAGTVILVVEMVEAPEETEGEATDSGGLESHDNAAVMNALENLGATNIHVVEGTPGLDL